MTRQAIHISLPGVDSRRTAETQPAISWSSRAMRRTEAALFDGLQMCARKGQGTTILVGTDYPGLVFTYELPVLRASAPLAALPYGLLAELLTNASKAPDIRAALRAEAHSLNLNLQHTLLNGQSPDFDDPTNAARTLFNLFDGLSDKGSLVIHLDGLHRADTLSLNLLRELLLRLAHKPLLFVGVYRADLPFLSSLSDWFNTPSFLSADFAPAWSDDLTVFLDAMFGRKAPLGVMIDIARNDDRLLLLGGVALLEACLRSGRWTEGLTLSERVITLAQQYEADYVAASARLVRSQILIGLGQWAEAQAECDTVIKQPVCAHDRNLTAEVMWGGFKARTALDLPTRHLLDALKRWRPFARTSDDPAVVAPILADMAVHFARAHQPSEARSWLSDLEALLDHSNHPAARLAVATAQGAVLVQSKDWRAASGAFRAAIDHAAQMRDLLLEARANSNLAFALLEVGDTDGKTEGRERLSLAHSVLSRLNARPDVELCEAGAKQFGLRPRQRRPTSANRTPGALTRREREVLALIVNGMTNRQIAQRLTISEKTAEGHVGNILAKLSCSSRIKAAELARATGLLEGGSA